MTQDTILEPDEYLSLGLVNHREDTREERQCLACGHARKVKVRTTHYEDGKVQRHWERLCTACQYLARALNHEEAAREFRKKHVAQKARQRRSK